MGKFRFEQYFATHRLVTGLPTPDGESVLFVTDISGQFNLWQVASGGGWPHQLTVYERESLRAVAVSPDGRRVAFAADPDGNERSQLYLMELHGGWPERITEQTEVQHSIEPGAFSPDGRYLVYAANSRVPTAVDLYRRDLATGEVTMLISGGWFHPQAFSPDGRWLLALQLHSNMDTDVWLLDLSSGAPRNLTAHPGSQARILPFAWRPDSSGFYYTSNQGREFQGIGCFDLAAEQGEYLITPAWDVEEAALAPDGHLLAYAVNVAGASELHVVDLGAGAELPLPRLPRGVVGGLRFAGQDQRRRLFLVMGTYAQAGAVFALDLERGELRQVTESMLGNLPPEAFVEPELVHLESHGGLRVPAWLYRPPGARAAPAVLSIHGGPEDQERPSYRYNGFYQYLLSHGIAVLAPNIRGSTGFGTAYQRLIYRDWGGGELQDIAACAAYLKALPWVDPQRVAIWGGSFGGFAALEAATRLPDLWACACDIVGPSNLVTFTSTVPPHWQALTKELVGDPVEDREMLLARSPITYVDQLRCPLLVVQGANDMRVAKAESDQMVDRLCSLGRRVEYLVFADEGHGFAKRSNQLRAYATMGNFLCRHLGVEQ